VKRTVREHYPRLPESKLATLFNGVDVTKFDRGRSHAATPGLRERFEIPADACLALMVAQDFQRKGLAEAIRALPSDDPRLELLVVGSGGNQQRYQQQAIEAGVALRVTFAGSRNDPREAYQSADFFVLPTRHDPCSLVVLEALAMGLPVISTVFNGATEIMTDGVHGFVLPDPRDVDALRDRYRRMLDPAKRAAMSRACLALRPQLSQHHHVEKLISIYESIKA
jgi:UDP-glucose:(heptosyl)LPS alpha-1,3-glucosyltransferase